jgi:hypothetical protein
VLPHLGQIAYARVECCEEAVAKVVAQAVAVGWAVDAEENEGREFDNEAAAFCVEGFRVDTETSDLGGSRIATNACIFGELSVGRR